MAQKSRQQDLRKLSATTWILAATLFVAPLIPPTWAGAETSVGASRGSAGRASGGSAAGRGVAAEAKNCADPGQPMSEKNRDMVRDLASAITRDGRCEVTEEYAEAAKNIVMIKNPDGATGTGFFIPPKKLENGTYPDFSIVLSTAHGAAFTRTRPDSGHCRFHKTSSATPLYPDKGEPIVSA